MRYYLLLKYILNLFTKFFFLIADFQKAFIYKQFFIILFLLFKFYLNYKKMV